MTFTLPGPTPGTYYECHHVFVAKCQPLEVSIAGKAVAITKGKTIKARRRKMTMKADRATFKIPT